MILRLGMILALMLTWSCSDDDAQQVKEPVAAENKLPDSPGLADAAKSAADSATDTAAAAAAAVQQTMPEKSVAPEPAPAPAAVAQSSAGTMVVKAGGLNVRKGPGTKHAVVRTLKKGETVSPLSCTKNWCKLAESEFVSKKYLKASN